MSNRFSSLTLARPELPTSNRRTARHDRRRGRSPTVQCWPTRAASVSESEPTRLCRAGESDPKRQSWYSERGTALPDAEGPSLSRRGGSGSRTGRGRRVVGRGRLCELACRRGGPRDSARRWFAGLRPEVATRRACGCSRPALEAVPPKARQSLYPSFGNRQRWRELRQVTLRHSRSEMALTPITR